jgi:hypothetical protein
MPEEVFVADIIDIFDPFEAVPVRLLTVLVPPNDKSLA